MPRLFQQQVVDWYKKNGRKDLPWQHPITPYTTWVSEIMLQQTQVVTVINYFNRFIRRFPHIASLAESSLDEVLMLWAGLGYYSRARNLHKTAKIIHETYGGHFPTTSAELEALPGIGRSTAGAILSLSMNQPVPILDGNVKRVFVRYFAIQGWPFENKVLKQLWQIAQDYMPNQNTAAYTQAMMDLGAMICTPHRPHCTHCPLNKTCQANQKGLQLALPTPKPRKEIPQRHTFLLIMQNEAGDVLFEKRSPTGIWGGLWSFPERENRKNLDEKILKQFGLVIQEVEHLTSFTHTFSHFRLSISPLLIHVVPQTDNLKIQESSQIYWQNLKEPLKIGLPGPIQKLFTQILKKRLDSKAVDRFN